MAARRGKRNARLAPKAQRLRRRPGRQRRWPGPVGVVGPEVGVSTVIAWVARFRETGSVAPGQMGGHRPKKLIGAWRDWLLERCRERDFTLRGLVAELGERGLKVDYRTVWEFVHAEGLTHKKRR